MGSWAPLAVNQPNTKVSAMGELTFQLGRNKSIQKYRVCLGYEGYEDRNRKGGQEG